MGDMGDFFKDVKEYYRNRNRAREDFYAPIIEKLGGRYIAPSTYRLGEYNVYVSKGYVLPKSNKGKSIPLQVFLKDKYNIEIDDKKLKESMEI